MTESATPFLDLDNDVGVLRVRTVVTLRWAAAIGQGTALAAAWLVFDARPPLVACAALIMLLPLSTLVLFMRYRENEVLPPRMAALSQFFDLAQLVALLGVTGGIANPFAPLLCAPVAMAAAVLTQRATVLLAATALVAATALFALAAPLTFIGGESFMPPPLFLAGIWTAACVSIVFVTMFARRIAIEAARVRVALTAAQLALERERRLSAIGALAAAAAHELGTPLGTIKLVARELSHELKDQPETKEDIDLLLQQAERCTVILRNLAADADGDPGADVIPAFALIEEAARPHRRAEVTLRFRLQGEDSRADAPDQPFLTASPELLHGMRNLLQNAFEFASGSVWADFRQGPDGLTLVIADDGPGFPPEILRRIGEPFLSSRRRAAHGGGKRSGMGLGLFITASLLSRTGAHLEFSNVRSPEPGGPSGAVATVRWPPDAGSDPPGATS